MERTRTPVLAMAGGFGLLVVALWGYLSWADWRERLAAAETTSRGVTRLVEERTRRMIVVSDLTLRGIAERVGPKDPALMAGEEGHRWFKNLEAGLPVQGTLWLVSDQGRVIQTSFEGAERPKVDLSDRDYFRAAQRGAPQPYLGEIVKGRLNGRYGFTVSRRLDGPDGQFRGVVVAGLESEDLRQLHESLSLPEGAISAVYRLDGRLMFRHPMTDHYLGQNLHGAPLFTYYLPGAASGSFPFTSIMDGKRRIYSYRRIGGWPLVASVGLPLAPMEDAWWNRFLLRSLGAGASLASILLLTLATLRGLRGQATARLQLQAANRSLEQRVNLRTRALEDELKERARIEAQLRQSEDKLVALNRDLEDRVRARTADLEQALAEIGRSNQDLAQFAYVASHDLREPLRMVSSYMALIERKYGVLLDDQGREFIHFAVDGAKRMDRLILDLLEYSRIGRSERPMAPVDLSRPLERALVNLTVPIRESGAEIVCPAALPVLWVDEVEIERLFQNLIANALKFRLPERRPRIEVTARPGVAGRWSFAVSDNGIGIAPEALGRIFAPFSRLHGHGQYEGTGMGLAICERIVAHHGGRIEARSVPGEGATLLFDLGAPGDRAAILPVSPDSAEAPAPDNRPSPPPGTGLSPPLTL